ncbi:MAG: tetratricopeptide repeat protein [Rhodospirillaceae bacterium]
MAEMPERATTSPDPFESALAQAQHANQQGDWAGAETALRKCLALQPSNGIVFGYLGMSASKLGRRAEAIELFEKAVQLGTRPIFILALADEYEAAGMLTDAWARYKKFLKYEPTHAAALMKLGGVKDRLGDKPGARECYRLAYEANPDDIMITHKYTNAIWAKDPEKALRLTERLLEVYKDDVQNLSAVLTHVICQKEWYERIKRGLMPYHCSRVDELFFDHARDYVKQLEATSSQLVAAYPESESLRLMLATARFALKDRHGAEAIIRTAVKKTKGHIYETVRFAPEFYDELRAMPDADIARGLPPRIEVTPPCPDANGVLYLSCNYTYFYAFAFPMIVSLRERSPATPVHVHIMDADQEQTDFALAVLQRLTPLKFALSVERPRLKPNSSQAKCYYHAVRFIRYYEHLKLYGCPLWLMDVDAVINRDLKDLFAEIGSCDAAMRIRPGRLEPWNQFNACMVAASQSTTSIEYFRLIAAYIAHFQQNNSLRWGIDQLAMYGVYADMEDRGTAPSLCLLGEREVDYDYREDGFVWCNSGAGKFKHLERISNPKAMPFADFEENRFVAAFETLWSECQSLTNSVLSAVVAKPS